MENTMSGARPCWRSLPFTRQNTSSLVESPGVHRHHLGPDGAERVEPFRPVPLLFGPLQVPRGHVVHARDPGDAAPRLDFRHAPSGRPMDDADSPSKSTCCDSGGSTIAAPSPMTAVGG